MDEKTKQRGFLEDIRMGCELGVTSVFDAVRCVVRRVLALPSRNSWTPTPRGPSTGRRTRSEGAGLYTEVMLPAQSSLIVINLHAACRGTWCGGTYGDHDVSPCRQ